jgi:hypothetical protein
MIGILYVTLTLPTQPRLLFTCSRIQDFEDYPKLDKVLAVFYEALRMFRKYHIPCDAR